MHKIRRLVSGKKFRYQKDGFDLDLSYITDRIIAMGYPAVGKKKIYRNPLHEVQRFFKTYHADHYKIFNLCTEKDYDKALFDNRVEDRLHFEDHGAPPFQLLVEFCMEADRFLQADKSNVIAVHCKAGKGRAGAIICCYLLWSGVFKNHSDAMKFFGQLRSSDGHGVTLPCQQRFIEYFASCIDQKKFQYPRVDSTILLDKITLYTTPHFDLDGGSDPYFILNEYKYQQFSACKVKSETTSISSFDSRDKFPLQHYNGAETIVFENINQKVTGTFKMSFLDWDKVGSNDHMFDCWLHTSFLPNEGVIALDKSQLDGPHKDKKNKEFDAKFKIEIVYKTIEEAKSEIKKLSDPTLVGSLHGKHANQSIQAHTQKAEKYLGKGLDLMHKKKYKEAIKKFTKGSDSVSILSDDPDSVELLINLYLNRAYCKSSLDQIEESIQDCLACEKAFKQYTQKAEYEENSVVIIASKSSTHHALMLDSQGKFQDAEPIIQQAVDRFCEIFPDEEATFPDLIAVFTTKAIIQQHMGQLRASVDTFSELVEMIRDEQVDKNANQKVAESLFGTFNNRARALMKLHQYQQALDDLARALEEYQECSDKADVDCSQTEILQSRCYIQMKNAKCFDILTALTKSGKNADAYYWLGVAHLALKNDADQALTQFTKAISLDKNHFMAKYKKAKAILLKGDSAKALKEFQELAKSKRGFVKCELEVARLILAENNPKKYPEVLRLYANIIEASRRTPHDELVVSAEDLPKIIGEYADVFRRLGKKDEVVKLLLTATETSPENPDLLFNLGNAYVEMENLEKAEECFKEVLKCDPAHKGAKSALEDLF